MSASKIGVAPEELGAWLDSHEIHTVRSEGMTLDGPLIGKQLSRHKFEKAFPDVAAISDMAFGFDLSGTPQLGWWSDWRAKCLGDVLQRADLSTLTALPDRPGVASVICDSVTPDGVPVPVCGRSLLKTMVQRLAGHGYTAKAAFEVEFFVFTESLAGARSKGFRKLTPLTYSPSGLGYLTINEHVQAPFMSEVCRRLDGLGLPWENWNDEAAPGQIELNFDPADPVSAADFVARAKQVLREVAWDRGLSVTFMAKPSEQYGSGMHVHHSLWRSGEPVFYDASTPDHRSALMCQWIAGQVSTVAAATSLLVPTINSYRRMVPFVAAPTHVAWGEQDKSAAIRTLTGTPNSTRIEYRNPAADVNPYVALAAMLACGMYGLEHAPDLPAESTVVAWGLPPGHGPEALPNTITKAADALEANSGLREILGEPFVEFWLNSRRWEWLMYHTSGGDAAATSVTDWELLRYFDVV